MTDALRVLVVDDHPLWRDTLVSLLQQMGVAREVMEADDGKKAVALARKAKPDVVIMDMQLPELDGVAAASQIRADPGCPVLMLCSSDEARDVREAVRAGASGYLVKTAVPREIVDAVRRVHAGELAFPPAIASVVMDELVGRRRDDSPLASLTEKERSVLALMAEGHSNQAIAEQLFMSPKTVESHVTAIFGKLGLTETPDVHRRVKAVVEYLRAESA